MDKVAASIKSSRQEAGDKVQILLAENRALQKQLEQLSQKMAASQSTDLVTDAIEIQGTSFLAAKVDGDNKAMMQTLDTLKSQLKSSVIVLAQESGGKVGMVVAVSADLHGSLQAADLLNHSGGHVGVKGGGRPDLARGGGGSNPAALSEAFAAAQDFVRQSLET